jgi:hypothetical protein
MRCVKKPVDASLPARRKRTWRFVRPHEQATGVAYHFKQYEAKMTEPGIAELEMELLDEPVIFAAGSPGRPIKSLERIRKRLGRCYELAAKVMLNEAESDRFTLIHGTVGGLGHAWIELGDGRIYDTTLNRYYPSGQYLKAALAVHRYSRSEVIRMVSMSCVYGPWTDDERHKAAALP